MCKTITKIWAMMLCMAFICCNNKPKPVSKDIAKTAVTVNGKKDSVINNPKKNYGNATVAEPCVKCFIDIVQHTVEYKKAVESAPVKNISYVVNWAEAARPQDTAYKRSATNSLKLDIIEKSASQKKITSFVYDNALSKLYFLSMNSKKEVNVDSGGLKRIRDKCYWGVASGK
jgi:hypothetical protein